MYNWDFDITNATKDCTGKKTKKSSQCYNGAIPLVKDNIIFTVVLTKSKLPS